MWSNIEDQTESLSDLEEKQNEVASKLKDVDDALNCINAEIKL